MFSSTLGGAGPGFVFCRSLDGEVRRSGTQLRNGLRIEQLPRHSFDHLYIHRIAQRLVSRGLGLGQVLEVSHALEPCAFAHGHVATLPRDHGHLASRQRDERGGRRRDFARMPDARNWTIVPHRSLGPPFQFHSSFWKLGAKSRIDGNHASMTRLLSR